MGQARVEFVGRMGLPSSVSMALLGTGLTLSGFGRTNVRRRVPLLALVSLSIGVLSITGYLYGADALFTDPRATAISLQSAVFILALSIGVIALHPEHRPMRWLVSPSAVGVVARRAVPTVVLAPIVLGWATLQGERLGLYGTRSALRCWRWR